MKETIATLYFPVVLTGTVETFYSSFVVTVTETVATLYIPVVLTGTIATLYSSFVYLYLAVAWSSELFVFHCGLEIRARCISLWLGVPKSPNTLHVLPSSLYCAVAWSSELSFVIGLIYPGDSLFCPWSGLSTRE